MSSITRAMSLLRAVTTADQPPRLADLVERLELPKATAHRLLASLSEEGLVRVDSDNQTYLPGYGLLELAYRTWDQSDVRLAARRHMRALQQQVHETIHLAVRDGPHVIYIDKLESGRGLRLFSAIGKRGPLYCTGVGKVMLAMLPESVQEELIRDMSLTRHTAHTLSAPRPLRRALRAIRASGFATDREEHEEGVRCVAAPVFSFNGEVVASLSVTGPSVRMDVARMQALEDPVMEAANAISADLGCIGKSQL